MKNARLSTIACALLLGLSAVPAVAGETPAVTHDGLERVERKDVDLLYTRPGASLAGYKRVAILDCHVAFRKNWQRDQSSAGNRVSDKEMQDIKTRLAAEFRKVFVDELQGQGGYQVVDEAASDVLVLRPAIIDLDVTAPDVMTAGRSRSFTTSAGGMTMYVEFFDGATGEILARAADRERARDSGRMTWTTSITNRQEADRMLRKWAKLAHDALDRARAEGAAAPQP